MATTFPIKSISDVSLIELGSLVQIGKTASSMELCRVDAIDQVLGTITVGRGCLDTPPKSHPDETELFFWDLYNGVDPTEYVLGETIDVKVTASSGAGQTSLDDAVEGSVLLAQRAYSPYAPGQFRVNGLYYPAGPFSDVLTVTWVDRDRLQQTSGTIYDHTLAAIGPEAATTYRLRGFVDGVLAHTEEPAVSGTTWTPAASGTVRIEVHALRNGVYSWQPARHEFEYILLTDAILLDTLDELDPGSRMLTEDNFNILQD